MVELYDIIVDNMSCATCKHVSFANHIKTGVCHKLKIKILMPSDIKLRVEDCKYWQPERKKRYKYIN